MKSYIAIWASIFTLFITGNAQASYTPYCQGTQATNAEDAVIQRLAPKFGMTMGCEVGENCLKKSDVTRTSEKFSLTWKKPCGPNSRGTKQTGDQGKSSTFACSLSTKGSVCCWPVGYEHVKKFNLCSDTIIKKK